MIHDLRCTNADEMYFPRLASRVKFLKEDEEGMAVINDYFEERQAKAVKREKENNALNLIALGKLTFDEIAKCLGLSLEQVKALGNGK